MVFDAVVELAPGGGDGTAGPAAGSVSALGVGADVGGGGVRVCLEVSQVLFRLSRWENLEYAKKI